MVSQDGEVLTFLCFERTFAVENGEALVARDSQRKSVASTKISISFPLDSSSDASATHRKLLLVSSSEEVLSSSKEGSTTTLFPLYAGLPVDSSVLLPFLVDCDFELTSSREHLNDNEWNKFLLQECAELYARVAAGDPVVRSMIAKMELDVAQVTSPLCRTFVSNCLARLRVNLGGKGLVWDGNIVPMLFSAEELGHYANVPVFDPALYGLALFKAVSLEHALAVLKATASKRDPDFWHRCFQHPPLSEA